MRISENRKMKAKSFFANKKIAHSEYDEEGRLIRDKFRSLSCFYNNGHYGHEDKYIDYFNIDTYNYFGMQGKIDGHSVTELDERKDTIWGDDELEVLMQRKIESGNGKILMLEKSVILDDTRLEWILPIIGPTLRDDVRDFYLSREINIINEDDNSYKTIYDLKSDLICGSLAAGKILLCNTKKVDEKDVSQMIYIDNTNKILVCFEYKYHMGPKLYRTRDYKVNQYNYLYTHYMTYMVELLQTLYPWRILSVYGNHLNFMGNGHEINLDYLCENIRNFVLDETTNNINKQLRTAIDYKL